MKTIYFSEHYETQTMNEEKYLTGWRTVYLYKIVKNKLVEIGSLAIDEDEMTDAAIVDWLEAQELNPSKYQTQIL